MLLGLIVKTNTSDEEAIKTETLGATFREYWNYSRLDNVTSVRIINLANNKQAFIYAHLRECMESMGYDRASALVACAAYYEELYG